MSTELHNNVKTMISSFLQTRRKEGNIDVDVLRAMRDQSELLLERQFIWDKIDSDPFELFVGDDDGNMKCVMERAKVR